MIKLDTEFKYKTFLFKQVKRTDKVALYEQTLINGKAKWWEVFYIKILPKGIIRFPNGLTKEILDDTEHYPASSQWGLIAWTCNSLPSALKKFDELSTGKSQEVEPVTEEEGDTVTEHIPSVKTPKKQAEYQIPEGEFSTDDLAKYNNIHYVYAHNFIKSCEQTNLIKFVREKRNFAKGRAKRIYAKT